MINARVALALIALGPPPPRTAPEAGSPTDHERVREPRKDDVSAAIESFAARWLQSQKRAD